MNLKVKDEKRRYRQATVRESTYRKALELRLKTGHSVCDIFGWAIDEFLKNLKIERKAE